MPATFTHHDGYAVLRDDLLPGGTKRRFLSDVLATIPEPELAYAGPSEGHAQLALGYAALDTFHHAHYFLAARAREHPLVCRGRTLGVTYHPQRPGYLSVATARARQWVAEAPERRALLPLGFHAPEYLAAAVAAVRAAACAFPQGITEVWAAWGSGLLATAIRDALPGVSVHAVVVGRKPKAPPGERVTLYEHPESFGKPARVLPPYPSALNYDAKVWEHAQAHGTPGAALIWNVAS